MRQLLQPNAQQRPGQVCDRPAEGAGAFPGPSVPERPHEGTNEETHRDGAQRSPEAPEAQEGQMCRHLTKL